MKKFEWNPSYLIGLGVSAVLFVLALIIIWFVFVPAYNTPEFQDIGNNQTGFLVPQDQDTDQQAHFDSAQYLKEKKVAAKRVQIYKRWVQTGWLPTTGHYIPTVRLLVVDRASITRSWTDDQSDTNQTDNSIRAQTQDGTGLKLNFTCTAFIPEIDENNPQGAEHFLYYYKGDTLEHIIDREVRARVQTVAAEFTAQFPLETLRGTQHKLADAVRADVVPFFKKRGISVTNVGLSGGFHYVNKELQKAIDDAIKAQQLKVTATAQQEKEKVEQQTRLQNQEITNKTLVLEAAGQAAANIARAEGDAKAKLAAANVDAEAAKVRATGEAAAIRIEADAEAYKYQQLEKSKDVMIMLKNIELERAWRSRWTGAVPSTVIQGGHSVLPIFPMNLDKNEHKK